MKQVICILLILISAKVSGQVEMKVKDIIVSNINPKITKDEVKDDRENGPFVRLTCQFTNASDVNKELKLSSAKFYIKFNYQNIIFQKEVFPEVLLLDNIVLIPNQNEEISIVTDILLGTNIKENGKYDYILEMLEILPTIKVIYNEIESDVKLEASEIMKVTVIKS